MNQILRGILIIYVISTLFYFIYKKYTDNQINKIIDNLDDEHKEAYNKINRYRILVFIIGIIIGLGILIFIEPDTIKKTINNVTDISDINVIS
jgi:hypothetical protein